MKGKPVQVQQAETFRCPLCNAEPGQPCRTVKTRRETMFPHVDRLKMADERAAAQEADVPRG